MSRIKMLLDVIEDVRSLGDSLQALADAMAGDEPKEEPKKKGKEEMRPSDSYAISAIMVRIEGWEKTDKSRRFPIYGKQRIYMRTG